MAIYSFFWLFVSLLFGALIEIAGWAWTTWKETVEPSDVCCWTCCWVGIDIVAEAGNETIWIWVGAPDDDWSRDWEDVELVFTAENCLSTWDRDELAVCGNMGTACWTFWAPNEDVVIDIMFGEAELVFWLFALAWLLAAAANKAFTVWLPDEVTFVSVDIDGNIWDLAVDVVVELEFNGWCCCCCCGCLLIDVTNVANVDVDPVVGLADNIWGEPLLMLCILIVCVWSPVVA